MLVEEGTVQGQVGGCLEDYDSPDEGHDDQGLCIHQKLYKYDIPFNSVNSESVKQTKKAHHSG